MYYALYLKLYYIKRAKNISMTALCHLEKIMILTCNLSNISKTNKLSFPYNMATEQGAWNYAIVNRADPNLLAIY